MAGEPSGARERLVVLSGDEQAAAGLGGSVPATLSPRGNPSSFDRLAEVTRPAVDLVS